MLRTTDTGGVKMIYNGLPSNNQCTATGTSTMINSSVAFNEDYDDPKYVGYMYDTDTDSTIKAEIDDWYSDSGRGNMTGVTSQLEDTIWCNDRNDSNSDDTYDPYDRVEDGTPSLSCTNKADSYTVTETATGNGLLTYKVGMLTSDEIMLAGGAFGSNDSYYLYNGQFWWSLSPNYWRGDYALGFVVYGVGALDDGAVDNEFGVRPAVSLQLGTTFSGGTGINTDPYVIA